MKSYAYEKSYFTRQVVLVGIFCVLILVSCIVFVATDTVLPRPIAVVVAVVAAYQVWNTFVAIANPETVEIGDDSIAFSAFGRTDSFSISEMKEFRVREFPGAGKMYVRVNGGGLFKGRYWLQTAVTSDGEELFHRILDIEYAKDPDSIKAQARRSSEAYAKVQAAKASKKERGDAHAPKG
jgi:hypothetical protein